MEAVPFVVVLAGRLVSVSEAAAALALAAGEVDELVVVDAVVVVDALEGVDEELERFQRSAVMSVSVNAVAVASVPVVAAVATL